MLMLATADPPRRHTKRAKLRINEVLAIYDSREKQIDLARRYGVTDTLINQIKKRKAWGWLLDWQRPQGGVK
jgi:hypothetical protein